MLDKLFVQDKMTEQNGTAVTLLYNLKFLSIKTPPDYSKSRATELLDHAQTGLTANNNVAPSPEQYPDIIVIMNETFSDLRILEEFDTGDEVMPFTDSILAGMDNTVSGYMNVPVLGGNTANTEFEFLTCHSMKNLPMGCIPYQQYINKDTESIISNLKASGYEAIALHPYFSNGWNRENVYDHFGFDRFISLADFKKPKLIREYVSDEADYSMIKKIISERVDNKPFFIFNVTMQNHGGYTNDNDLSIPLITTQGIDNKAFNCYLSLIRESDNATRHLTEYLSKSDRPVILVFFGDHQPADETVEPLYKLHERDITMLDMAERSKRYLVPYFIWTNYSIDTKTRVPSTPQELGINTLKMAGIELSNYQSFVDEYCKGSYTDSDYATVQYYEMFERELDNDQ